jgi:hypothetical protein
MELPPSAIAAMVEDQPPLLRKTGLKTMEKET